MYEFHPCEKTPDNITGVTITCIVKNLQNKMFLFPFGNYNTDPQSKGGRLPSTFSDNVPSFSKSPLNVPFLKILNQK